MDKTTPLQLAAQKGHTEVVRLLVKAGANKDWADRYGRTPLHLAAEEGNEEVVKLLLGNSLNIDQDGDKD